MKHCVPTIASNICVGNMTGRLGLDEEMKFQTLLEGSKGREETDIHV